ncbi:FRG domain-containing protein [Rathayibacter sp. VKM Ac-2759]|uniref:FRG domain-containing protein n=1 Tax=Rathayibacter sp. VKM Ac-2759 TaxID=2609252 RepID=UPI001316BEDD|nr:FRG domain-containing protein [Rathayibacter sp. VKM Ac-2759]QHC67959.1 FRG domain-containing protein [Rathayibacter sp. VKM Ac-2759]
MASTSFPDFAVGMQHRVEHGWHVWTVRSPQELTQVSGYLRFRGKTGLALFRGQSILYSDVLATAFRSASGNVGAATVQKHAAALRSYIDQIVGAPCSCRSHVRKYGHSHECKEVVSARGALLNETYRAAVEPLLQHYGLRTRWIDVVDNIWVALWFACHKQVSVGRYAHHARRSIAQEGRGAMAYVLVISTGAMQPTEIPGYQISEDVRFVDLRYCVPSLYLRPHAQHGALLAPRRLEAGPSAFGSMHSQVAGVIEVALDDALQWLGQGSMTSASVLFPGATHDTGFRLLLEESVEPPLALGTLTIYGPAE